LGDPSGLDREFSPPCTVIHDLMGRISNSSSACGWKRLNTHSQVS
jgi:hypothetical protein